MLEQFAVDIARSVTRIIEITGIAIIAAGAFGTLLLFLYRSARAGAFTNEAVELSIELRTRDPARP